MPTGRAMKSEPLPRRCLTDKDLIERKIETFEYELERGDMIGRLPGLRTLLDYCKNGDALPVGNLQPCSLPHLDASRAVSAAQPVVS